MYSEPILLYQALWRNNNLLGMESRWIPGFAISMRHFQAIGAMTKLSSTGLQWETLAETDKRRFTLLSILRTGGTW